MDTLNTETQYPLSTVQLRGVKSIINESLGLNINEVIEKVRNYTSVITFVKRVDLFEEGNKPYILIETTDTIYLMKFFKNKKEKPLGIR